MNEGVEMEEKDGADLVRLRDGRKRRHSTLPPLSPATDSLEHANNAIDLNGEAVTVPRRKGSEADERIWRLQQVLAQTESASSDAPIAPILFPTPVLYTTTHHVTAGGEIKIAPPLTGLPPPRTVDKLITPRRLPETGSLRHGPILEPLLHHIQSKVKQRLEEEKDSEQLEKEHQFKEKRRQKRDRDAAEAKRVREAEQMRRERLQILKGNRPWSEQKEKEAAWRTEDDPDVEALLSSLVSDAPIQPDASAASNAEGSSSPLSSRTLMTQILSNIPWMSSRIQLEEYKHFIAPPIFISPVRHSSQSKPDIDDVETSEADPSPMSSSHVAASSAEGLSSLLQRAKEQGNLFQDAASKEQGDLFQDAGSYRPELPRPSMPNAFQSSNFGDIPSQGTKRVAGSVTHSRTHSTDEHTSINEVGRKEVELMVRQFRWSVLEEVEENEQESADEEEQDKLNEMERMEDESEEKPQRNEKGRDKRQLAVGSRSSTSAAFRPRTAPEGESAGPSVSAGSSLPTLPRPSTASISSSVFHHQRQSVGLLPKKKKTAQDNGNLARVVKKVRLLNSFRKFEKKDADIRREIDANIDAMSVVSKKRKQQRNAPIILNGKGESVEMDFVIKAHMDKIQNIATTLTKAQETGLPTELSPALLSSSASAVPSQSRSSSSSSNGDSKNTSRPTTAATASPWAAQEMTVVERWLEEMAKEYLLSHPTHSIHHFSNNTTSNTGGSSGPASASLSTSKSSAMEELGLGRAQLLSLGFTNLHVNTFYSALFGYSLGIYHLLSRIVGELKDREGVMRKVWNTYLKLIELSHPSLYSYSMNSLLYYHWKLSTSLYDQHLTSVNHLRRQLQRKKEDLRQLKDKEQENIKEEETKLDAIAELRVEGLQLKAHNDMLVLKPLEPSEELLSSLTTTSVAREQEIVKLSEESVFVREERWNVGKDCKRMKGEIEEESRREIWLKQTLEEKEEIKGKEEKLIEMDLSASTAPYAYSCETTPLAHNATLGTSDLSVSQVPPRPIEPSALLLVEGELLGHIPADSPGLHKHREAHNRRNRMASP